MEFAPWIDSLAENDALSVAAELLGEKRRTVASWLRFERVPSFKAAMNIYEKSGGRVDFNGLYMPFLKAVREGRARFS